MTGGYVRVAGVGEDDGREHVKLLVATSSGTDISGADSRPSILRCATATATLLATLLLVASLAAAGGLLLWRLSHHCTAVCGTASTARIVPSIRQHSASTPFCRVEDSIGYWSDDEPSQMSWYVSLPGECRLYPFLHQLMQLPQPPQMAPWPTNSSPKVGGRVTAVADRTSFLHGRFVLWITDSIDRHPLAETCSRLGSPQVWAVHKYPDTVSPHYGLSVCHQPRINLTLVHAQTMGLRPDNQLAAMKELINQHIPRTLTQALSANNFTSRLQPPSSPPLPASPVSRPLHPCQFQPAVPDVLVVHSCRWDEFEAAMAASSPQHVAFDWWMKQFETQMLIPALLAYSQRYRLWQHAFILQRMHSQSDDVSDVERSEAYERLRAQLFTFQAASADSNATLTLAPNPHSHPIPSESDGSDVSDTYNERTSPAVGCPDEPFIVIRNCAPPRADLSGFHEREVTRAVINAGVRAVSRQYGVRLLDIDRMLDGVQGRPSFMWDFIHWNARPWLQTFNVLLNMFSQHLISGDVTAAATDNNPTSANGEWLV